MTNPEKVIGFLSITDNWDPSLMFVMGGAILFSAPFMFLFRNKKTSLLGHELQIPSRKDLDKNLIIGSSLFGIGWGLVGLCPGPAISSLVFLNPVSLIFVFSMSVGVVLQKTIIK
jgi:hypothetical protein